MQEPLTQSDSNNETSLESWSIQKDFHFEAAHRLENHNGKCSRLHGHSYKLEIEVGRNYLLEESSSKGMVVDFANVSKAVEDYVLRPLDHRFLATRETPQPFLDILRPEEYVYLFIPVSTAEHLAQIAGEILLESSTMMRGVLRRVTLWETETSKATWHRYGYYTAPQTSQQVLEALHRQR